MPLALVGSGVVLMAVLTAGQTFDGITRGAALLLPRGRSRGAGDFRSTRRPSPPGSSRGELVPCAVSLCAAAALRGGDPPMTGRVGRKCAIIAPAKCRYPGGDAE